MPSWVTNGESEFLTGMYRIGEIQIPLFKATISGEHKNTISPGKENGDSALVII